ncbi:MAG: MFS transporter [Acidobacteria bacterium]|nr:MFS transporter [Acidobacteriota bacterium]
MTPSFSPRRNVYTAAAANGIGFAGFTVVMPFLPLYIRELGVQDVADIALWTGLTLGATPAVTAFSAPLWGRVGDRYGSKILVLRSLSAFVLTKAAMAFVTAPWQLFALRALLGVFAGYGALTVSMAAESVPRERMAEAIGTVQVAQRLGPAIGPIIGGLLAPIVGLRRSFLIAAAFYFVAILLIAWFYTEPRSRQARAATRPMREVWRDLRGTPGFLLVFTVILCLQLVDRSFGPILPLYVERLVPPVQVPFVAGVLFSVAAISAAAGHHWAGPLLERYSSRMLIAVSSLLTALGLALLVAVPSVWAFAIALAVSGAAIGVGMTAAYTSGGALLPADAHATGFGIMTTASLVGLAVSPIVAGFISGPGLRIVFEADIVLLIALAALVWYRMR